MRFSDWQTRLSNYLDTAKKTPFTWGVHDCALFACGCIEALTGEDPAQELRGTYTDEEGAIAALLSFTGGGGLIQAIEILTARYGFEEVPALMAQRGDLVICLQGGQPTMGIVDFTGRAIMIAAPAGIIWHPIILAKRAWRIE